MSERPDVPVAAARYVHTDAGEAEIGISVRDDMQKRNLGRLLVEAAIARVAELKPDQIIVLTFTPPFFASLGFVPVSKEKLLYKLYKGCMNCSKYDNPLTCPEVAMAYDPRQLKPGTAS